MFRQICRCFVPVAFAASFVLPAHAIAAQPTAGIRVGSSDLNAQPHVIVAFDAASTGELTTAIQTTPDGATSAVVVTLTPAPVSPPTLGMGCSAGAPTAFNQAFTCVMDAAALLGGVEFWGSNGNDTLTMFPDDLTDVTPLTAYLRGGTGSQQVRGGHGDDVLDTAEGGSTAAAQNYLAGGQGVDTFVTSTQPNVLDTVNYDDGRTSADWVSVSINGVANDGNPSYDGGLEDVGSAATGMEGIVGSPGDDMIVGSAARNIIYARQGDDVIDGGDGNDTIFGGDGGDQITGGPGDDSVHGDFDQWGLGDNGTTGDGDDLFSLRDTGTDEDNVYQCGGGTDTGEIDGASKDNKVVTIPADCEDLRRYGSDGYISVFTFGAAGTERVIFDPRSNSLASTVRVEDLRPFGYAGAPPMRGEVYKITYTQALDSSIIEPLGPECDYAPDDHVDTTTHTVLCEVGTTVFNRGVEVWLGNGNSDFTADLNLTTPFLIHPEAGTNVVRGGSGSDTFDGAAFATVGTVNNMMGNDGADTFVGGVGLDLVDYLHHSDPGVAGKFVMSLDCDSNDGGTRDGNKNDDVGCSANGIDGIVGSNGRDEITGDAGPNKIYAQNGNDLVDGGGGDDTIYGGGDHDSLTGGAGADSVFGDRGATVYSVTPAPDGADTLTVDDGVADTVVDCGGGTDAAIYDRALDAPVDCENLTPPAVDPTPPVVAPSSGTVTLTGDAFLGRTLTASATFAGSNVDVTYVWSRCVDAVGANCSGFFTGSTYALVEGDVGSRIKVVATGTNAGGTASVERLTGVVGRPPNAACDRVKDQPQGDPDGDGLRNFYECGSVALDGQSMNLAHLGANPLHKDMFIEIDRKAGIPFSETAIRTMMETFDKAPVTNPDGRSGISLHVDHGPNSVTGLGTAATWGTASRSSDALAIGERLGSGGNVYDWTAFNTLKDANFEKVRWFAFRYVVVAERYGDTNSSGIAAANDWKTDNLGQDLIVALGPSGGSPNQQAGTLIHEFGHTLGLGHGGRDLGGNADHENHKPNYPSVMSYNWQMGGVAKKDGTFVYDYSRFGRPEFQVIDETKLIEKNGIDASGAGSTYRGMFSCIPPSGGALQKQVFDYDTGADFDCSGSVDAKATQRSMDISFGALTGETSRTTKLEPRDDWDAIVFTGGSIGGGGVGVGEAGIDTIQLDGSTIERQPTKMPNPDVHADVETLMESAQVAAGDAKKPTLKLSWKKAAKAKKPKKGKAAGAKTLPVTVVLTDNKAVSQLSVRVGKAAPQIVAAKKRAKSVKLVVKLAKGKSTIVVNGFDWIGNAVTLKRTFVVTCTKSGACTAR